MNQFMSQPTNSLVYMQYGASLAAFATLRASTRRA